MAAEIPEVDRAEVVADVIYEIEGRCDSLHGDSGEYGCFQYQYGTWKAYSNEIAGTVLPQTQENERLITEGMIQKWLDEGISERGIFLTWNQGSPTGWGPGTKDCYSGVNSSGVRYDSCDYAARALELLEEKQNRPGL